MTVENAPLRPGDKSRRALRRVWPALLTVLVVSVLFSPGLTLGSGPSGQELEIKLTDLIVLAEAVFLALTICMTGNLPMSRGMRLVVVYFSLYFFGIFVFFAATGGFSPGPIFFWGKQFEYFLICYIAYFAVSRNPSVTERVLGRTVWLFLASFLINAVFILYQVVTSQYWGVARAYERRASVIFETAVGASGQFMILSFLFLLLAGRKAGLFRSGLATLLLFIGLIFSLAAIGSTASAVSLVMVGMVALVLVKKAKVLSWGWKLAAGAGLASVAVYLARAQIEHQIGYIYVRLLRVLDLVAGLSLISLGNRYYAWKGTFSMVMKSPVVGFGTSSVPMTDNQFLKVTGEFGFIGLLVFLTVFIFLLRMYWGLARPRIPERLRYFSLFMFFSTLALLFHGLSADIFQPTRIMEPYWLLTGIFLGMYSVYRRRAQVAGCPSVAGTP